MPECTGLPFHIWGKWGPPRSVYDEYGISGISELLIAQSRVCENCGLAQFTEVEIITEGVDQREQTLT